MSNRIQEQLLSLEQTIGTYVSEMDRYTFRQFTRKPSQEEWSLGQMYNHLLQATQNFHLAVIERCAAGQAVEGGVKTPAGEQAFAAGSFPPVRIKVPPDREYTPDNPTDMQPVKEQMTGLVGQLRAAADGLPRISASQKAAHPAFGMLNAQEWFQLIEMHFRHHLRQKERLDRMLEAEAEARVSQSEPQV